jgi:hypothetical protein
VNWSCELESFGKEARGERERMEMEVKSGGGYATPAESEPYNFIRGIFLMLSGLHHLP